MEQKILEQAPMIIVDKSSMIIWANERVNLIFGFIFNAVEGKKLVELIPERFREIHEKHFNKYFEDPTYRSMGKHDQELIGLRKDGKEFKVRIQLEPWAHNKKWYVTGTIIEI